MNLKHIFSLLTLTVLIAEATTLTAAAQTPPQRAEVIQLAEISCREFLKMDSEDQDLMMTFLHGFINGRTNNMTIDVAQLSQATDAIENTCINNPQATLLSVTEKVRQGI